MKPALFAGGAGILGTILAVLVQILGTVPATVTPPPVVVDPKPITPTPTPAPTPAVDPTIADKLAEIQKALDALKTIADEVPAILKVLDSLKSQQQPKTAAAQIDIYLHSSPDPMSDLWRQYDFTGDHVRLISLDRADWSDLYPVFHIGADWYTGLTRDQMLAIAKGAVDTDHLFFPANQALLRVETPDTPSASMTPSNPDERQPAHPTMYDLSLFAHRYSRSGKSFSFDVNPQSEVWNHLVRDHGFSRAQVDGMQQGNALWLHAAAHNGDVTPQAIKWTPPAQQALQQPTAAYGGNCANGQCANNRRRR